MRRLSKSETRKPLLIAVQISSNKLRFFRGNISTAGAHARKVERYNKT
nr:MAG TPA: hypothetical protein [Caudoviricetes sp.]